MAGNYEDPRKVPVDIAMPVSTETPIERELKPETLIRIAQLTAMLESGAKDSPGDSGV